MTTADSGEDVTVLLDFTRKAGMFVGFHNKEGEEELWLKDTSIVGGMGGVECLGGGKVRLTVRNHIFRRRRAELCHFVST